MVWVALWLSFIARELFRKGYIHDYTVLLSRHSLEEKRSYVYGDDFYKFLIFCKNNLPEGSSFGLAGVREDSIDIRRASYYLYPNLSLNDGDFILVYNSRSLEREGYHLFASLDGNNYILKKR
jgi:hypothetical protein